MCINPRYKKEFLLFGLMSLFFTVSFGQTTQTDAKPISFGIQSYYGFLLKHKPALGAIIQGHPFGLEGYVERIKTGEHYWEKAYRYPRVGMAFGGFDMGSPQIGQMYYLIHYLEKDLTKSQTGGLYFKIGYGLGYCTNPFNLENNYQNIAISSRFSFAMRGALGYAFSLSKEIELKSGLTITHFSNGAFKVPNSGINIVTTHLGLAFTPEAKRITYRTDAPAPHFRRGWTTQLSGAFTLKEFGLPGGQKYPGFVVMAHASRRLNYKSALNIGLDGTYNTALKEEIATDPTLTSERKPDFKRAALAFGHELYISRRLSLLTQLGVYVYKKYTTRSDGPIYQRYGLRYYLPNGVFGAMSLKSHFGTADFVEWTVGINL
jgi:hypothetical protein